MGAALAAASIIVVVGIVDDRWGLDALTKFVGQVTAAGVLVIMGVSWIVIYDRSVPRHSYSTSSRAVSSPSPSPR